MPRLPVPKLPHKRLTLAFIERDGAVLLGMKKRGFGMGKWNGFGGKVEPSDASIVAAAAREVCEEANVSVEEWHLAPRGVLFFSFEEAKEVMVSSANDYGFVNWWWLIAGWDVAGRRCTCS